MLSDIEIAQQNKMEKIQVIADKCGLTPDDIEQYGHYKAKISFDAIRRLESKPDGKLVLVTAITPTPAGEGKSTTSIGLVQGLQKIGKNAIATLREPSLGPVFGIKGGAAGGGYAQVVPMDDINLHFTGDMHAITAANNLLSAMIDNHIHQGNELQIDLRQLSWTRVLDMNDRALRNVTVALGGKVCGFPREDHFMITVASEIMAILCLAKDLEDLKERFGRIVIGCNLAGEPVYVHQLGCQGAMALLMKDAIKPNLVQTLEHTPAIVHGGPFANIAHGCNSIVATKLGLKLGDIVVTEAGFGADLGAEKFLDIKCRYGEIFPDTIVIVATLRALKMHGGVPKQELSTENVEAVTKGFSNLQKAIENMRYFNVPVLVAINKFATDTDAEIAELTRLCDDFGVPVELNECWENGGEGGIAGKAEDMNLKLSDQASLSLAESWKYRVGCSLADMPPAPIYPEHSSFPSVLFNGMVHPCLEYPVKGVIWYQGCNNVGRAEEYESLFQTLITDWRKQFGQPDMPFYFVQLANYLDRKLVQADSPWAALREAQSKAQHLAHTGMAANIDIGEAHDIHPKNKQEVARRLAVISLADTYGQKIPAQAPVYDNYTVENGKVRISFTIPAIGERFEQNKDIKGFIIAGPDHVFYPAEAYTEGDEVVVYSHYVKVPVAVRYGWADNPECTLRTPTNLPVAPFRTDNW